MTENHPTVSIPSAWLKPIPQGYQIPIWRWVLLPATALMLKRNGGVWMSGTLTLDQSELRFAQTKVIKSARLPLETWSIPLNGIIRLETAKGLASETLIIHHAGGMTKLMTVRAESFIDQLRSVVPHE